MNRSLVFGLVLLIVALVPFVVFGAVRLAAWAMPAFVRWSEAFERRHPVGLWLALAVVYLFCSVAYFVRSEPEPVLAVVWGAMAIVALVRAVRRHRTRSSAGAASTSA